MINISLPIILTGLFFTFEKYLTKPWMRWLWWCTCALIVGLREFYAGQYINWFDFKDAYYFAGYATLTDLSQLYSAEICVFGFVNFPLLAYLFTPFGLLPLPIAGQIFYALGYISIMPLAYWLIKLAELDGWKRWAMLAILIINDPLEYSLDIGNTTHFVMIIIVLSLWWFKQGKDWLSGMALGFIGLMKPTLIPSFGYFFVRRQWQIVGGGLLIAGLAITLSFLLIPLSLNTEWVNKCILASVGQPIAAYNNQSLSGFLARYLIPTSDVFSWVFIIPDQKFNITSNILMALFYLPIILIIFINWKSRRTIDAYILEFLIIFVCSLLTSPISWTHYYMFFLIPVSFYIKEYAFTGSSLFMNLLFGFSLALLSTPTSLILRLYELTDQRIFLSIHFVGGVLFYIFLLAFWYIKRHSFLHAESVSN